MVTVDPTLIAGIDTITNTAEITDDGANGPDPTPGDNTDDEPTPVEATPNLAIIKDDGGLTAPAGGIITYTLTYTNTGDQDAIGVVITDIVPAHTTFISSTSTPGWNCTPDDSAGSTCTLNIGTVAAGTGGSATFTVVVDQPLPAGVDPITNTAEITDDGANGPDPTPDDNSSTDDTPIDAVPDLIIAKDADGITTVPGGLITYTLTYTNAGIQDATGIVITETVPNYTSFDPGNSSVGWDCDPDNLSGSTCILNLGTVPSGTSDTITFTVIIESPLSAGGETITNTVIITDDGDNGPDPTPDDNSDNEETPVDASPDLTLIKTDNQTNTVPGATLVYTLTYANVGDQDASDVEINETVPRGTTFNADAGTPGWSCNDNAPAGTNCTLSIGTLPVSTTGSVTFAVALDNPLEDGLTTVANQATITSSNDADDPTPDNNSDTDTTNFTVGSLGNFVWIDTNKDSIQDNNETGIGGVIVNLYDADNNLIATTITDPSGLYEFTNLGPGAYYVEVELPEEYAFSPQGQDGNDSQDSDVDIETGRTNLITLEPGENDPDWDAGIYTLDPTAIVLVSFTANHAGDEVKVRWETSAEINTWGFHLYRSTDKDRANAERVTSEIILAQGRGQSGTTYSWTDTNVSADETYTYWLEETEVNGTSHEYGSTTAVYRTEEAEYNVFLPLITLSQMPE
ncbi:MAG: hypothetical protein GFH27_549279n506 [Chloroflexi bacterium AL-W]|nr:hypothetical protein [Chloroflexi bacterium AL-N1]NOK65471.1 hypothetical protein [Chloroflexi bacterium AL-N10]NOK72263.1 hypothetical protein [Chloroflexi bacterium AL-N5]NOK79651.1 hypothetical protein [Chloroflexi bacterium AL-W]NOK87566.1 hypothetical protein [Chloroflexi bacterium AL-N15]